MQARAIIVLDIGKTLAKLSLWSFDGRRLAREARPNARIATGAYVALDSDGIAEWLVRTLSVFARKADVGAIIPVAHGAAAAVVRDGRLVCPPLDYEDAIPSPLRRNYEAWRDPFAATGSPALPDGLNLGVQFLRLQSLVPGLLGGDAVILPWAQYWAWLLSGVAASEVTSLGCHTDLWRPAEARPSRLAQSQGWAAHLAPLRGAGEILGTITPEWAARTGLPADVRIHCGLHDSNAALLAARAFDEIAEKEATILSTGTWFVAMRSPAPDAQIDLAALPEGCDCLVNLDVAGRMVPSGRFMGGREIETLLGPDMQRIDMRADQPALIAAVPRVLVADAMILPGFAPGSGPFPRRRGGWTTIPVDPAERRAAICLYAALMADLSLSLIGSCERLLIEGRFAASELFVRALATLRPDMAVYAVDADNDVSYGALRLLNQDIVPAAPLVPVVPLGVDLTAYKARWRHAVERMEQAA